MPDLKVTPSEALVDEMVQIKASGLHANERITICANLKEKEVFFNSCGHYVTDKNGIVDTFTHPSFGGTFTGIENMGLFWSMKPAPGQPLNSRILRRKVTTPLIVDIFVYIGHLDLEILHSQETKVAPVASTSIQRWYKKDDVKRIIVREGPRIRGALFLPPGNGPFPGVIDLFGAAGGLVETRAALLASKGFAVLALAYFAYEDLCKDITDVDFDLFMEAADWLSLHPVVRNDGIGVVGISKGAELALLLAENHPKVKATVNINGSSFYTTYDLQRGGKLFKECVTADFSLFEMNEKGFVTKNAFPGFHGKLFETWRSDAKFLFIHGLDDQSFSSASTEIMRGKFEEHNKAQNLEILYYPGAGHLIEPPYMPLCQSSLFAKGINAVWGGQPKPHADAQEDAWRRIIQFLRQNLLEQSLHSSIRLKACL